MYKKGIHIFTKSFQFEMHLVQNSQVLLGAPPSFPGENKYWFITIFIISQPLKVAKYAVRLADKGIAI